MHFASIHYFKLGGVKVNKVKMIDYEILVFHLTLAEVSSCIFRIIYNGFPQNKFFGFQ